MRTRRLARLTAGLATGLVALALLALPVGANTVGVGVTGGTGFAFQMPPSSTVWPPTPIGPAPPGCSSFGWSGSVTTAGTSTSGTIDGTLDLDGVGRVEVSPLQAATYRFDMTLTLPGSYSLFGEVFGGGGTLTGTAQLSSSTFPCAPLPVPPCVVDAIDIDMAGWISAADPSNLVTGDEIAIWGGNDLGETSFTGTCPVLALVDDGQILYDFELTVL